MKEKNLFYRRNEHADTQSPQATCTYTIFSLSPYDLDRSRRVRRRPTGGGSANRSPVARVHDGSEYNPHSTQGALRVRASTVLSDLPLFVFLCRGLAERGRRSPNARPRDGGPIAAKAAHAARGRSQRPRSCLEDAWASGCLWKLQRGCGGFIEG